MKNRVLDLYDLQARQRWGSGSTRTDAAALAPRLLIFCAALARRRRVLARLA